MANFFGKDASISYDEKNKKLAPIADNMHFLVRLILQDLPKSAHILCVGVGTGAEILALADAYPGWTFVGVDPSDAMLEVCRERLQKAGVLDRCVLIHGYVHDIPVSPDFDAVLSILVGHFIPETERADFYTQVHMRLRSGGYFINTEISFDLDAEEFTPMLENWKAVQTLMGATPESLSALPDILRRPLTVLAPSIVEQLLKNGGFSLPVRFFQAFMISGWYGKKEDTK